MDIQQARTFLAINAHGCFLEAARQLYLTQSTVRARIQRLEEELGTRLFVRKRSGTRLTSAGWPFLEHAKRRVCTEEEARPDVELPSRYHATIRIGGRIARLESVCHSRQAGCIASRGTSPSAVK
jgi:DNA-binding transcriptional LysR family regulator